MLPELLLLVFMCIIGYSNCNREVTDLVHKLKNVISVQTNGSQVNHDSAGQA